jgi:hypothetical protein
MSSLPGFLQVIEEQRPSKNQHSSDTSSGSSSDEEGTESDSPKRETLPLKRSPDPRNASSDHLSDPLLPQEPPADGKFHPCANYYCEHFICPRKIDFVY